MSAGSLVRLIYFSPVQWQSYEQRPHKFVRYFRQRYGGEVLWVQPYPVRLPTWDDLRRKSGILDQQTPLEEGVGCVPVTVLPVEPIPIARSVNALLTRTTWKRIEIFAAGARRLILGVGKPSALAFQALERIGHDVSFYDAMDNFPAFYSGLSRAYMARIESRLTAGVNRLYASSESIQHRLQDYHGNGNVQLLHNACDVEAIPSVPRSTRKKRVFGYIGSVGHWFDWRLFVALASAVPEAEFRLVGPVFESPEMSLPPNVTLLGPRPHSEAAEMLREFTVGLIPFKKNELTDGVDPIKYYEYICAGLPVVSTAFGEMARRGAADGVFKVSAGENLRPLLQRAAAHVFAPSFIQEFRRLNDWSTRLRPIDELGDPACLNP